MKRNTLLLTFILMITMSTTLQAQKALVVYFSWSGNTKMIAYQIKEFINADIFEIVPEKAYSTSYNICVDEAKKEKESNARPAYLGSPKNIESYDVIFIGFPNWWGTMPMVLNTFLENTDLAGKTVIPFCTHGGGGVQQCFKDFQKQTTDCKTQKGFLVNGSSAWEAEPEVEKWLRNDLKLLK